MDDPVWDPTMFRKNRDRLLAGDIADAFFAEVLAAIKGDGLLSADAFYGRWHAARSLGESQEFQTRRTGTTARPMIRTICSSITRAGA